MYYVTIAMALYDPLCAESITKPEPTNQLLWNVILWVNSHPLPLALAISEISVSALAEACVMPPLTHIINRSVRRVKIQIVKHWASIEADADSRNQMC